MTRSTALVNLALSIVVAIVLIRYRNTISALASYGYSAAFLLSLLTHVTVVIPAPTYGIAIGMAASLHPLGLGIAMGLGAGLGESVAYGVGTAGQDWAENDPRAKKLKAHFDRYGAYLVFAMAAIPNPLFDVMGLVAGAARMPLWKFLSTTALGKGIRFSLVAWLAGRALSI